MKKLMALILAGIMVFAFAACGGDGAAKGGAAKAFDGSEYNLDLTAEEVQPMSEERATVEVLAETANDWLEGATLHAYSEDKKSYEDVVAHIGCDPSEYQYDAKNSYRVFTWRAEDDDTAWFCAFFQENNGAWELYATSSANLGFVM